MSIWMQRERLITKQLLTKKSTQKCTSKKNAYASYELRKKVIFNKYGLIHEPDNEAEVVFLFTKIHGEMGYDCIKTIQYKYPDCIAIDKNDKEIRIEFEFKSSNFRHDPKGCDIVICWQHDWLSCPIKVISLKDLIIGMEFSNCYHETIDVNLNKLLKLGHELCVDV